MVSQCANPRCAAPFRYLNQGRLFLVERKKGNGNGKANGSGHGNGNNHAAARLEYFWLCSDCAPRMTLETERGTGTVRVSAASVGPQPAFRR